MKNISIFNSIIVCIKYTSFQGHAKDMFCFFVFLNKKNIEMKKML